MEISYIQNVLLSIHLKIKQSPVKIMRTIDLYEKYTCLTQTSLQAAMLVSQPNQCQADQLWGHSSPLLTGTT